ncbi:class I SAM-dependent methyltransferase [Candidatus Nitrosopumilus sediminis]|uniref:Methyltransferase type 11 n=1 Tax=Candidatus Nitrosopumilus sediminis TaxID=1229909 RepID=K0BBN7_9ARCH|nr:methyltransferase domain-containing protein [Candidatus Nitrosopumilus sediminis]AFS82879.1 methyltransferase type 11 [Candidatus Nitrosopumilus sediminis]
MSSSIIKAYRKYADNYDFAVKLYRLLGIKIGKYRKMTVNSLELSKGDTVVELGCGTGLNFSLILDKIGEEGKLIGVDITDKMLDQAKKRVNGRRWKNVELVESDFAKYQFPQKLDGIFATGALQYSIQYDKIIKQGHDALKPNKKFAIMDFKMSQGPAKIFAPLIIFFTKPFGANEEYLKRTAWKSIEKYFEKTSYREGWGGFLYLSVGTKV